MQEKTKNYEKTETKKVLQSKGEKGMASPLLKMEKKRVLDSDGEVAQCQNSGVKKARLHGLREAHDGVKMEVNSSVACGHEKPVAETPMTPNSADVTPLQAGGIKREALLDAIQPSNGDGNGSEGGGFIPEEENGGGFFPEEGDRAVSTPEEDAGGGFLPEKKGVGKFPPETEVLSANKDDHAAGLILKNNVK